MTYDYYNHENDNPYAGIISQRLLQRARRPEKRKNLCIDVLDNGQINIERRIGNICKEDGIYIQHKGIVASAYNVERSINLKPKKIIHQEFEWFKSNLSELKKQYNGQWIAIFDKKLIAHSDSFSAVYKIAKEKGCKRPFITLVQ